MTFRDELIEAGAHRYARWRQDVGDGPIPDWCRGPYQASFDNAVVFMAAALDAMLAYRTTEECPTCVGERWVWVPDSDPAIAARRGPCPDCTDGRVPRDTPRLEIVE